MTDSGLRKFDVILLDNLLDRLLFEKSKWPEMLPFQAILLVFPRFFVVEIRRIELLTS